MWLHNFSSSVRKASFFLPVKVKQLWCFGVLPQCSKIPKKCLICIFHEIQTFSFATFWRYFPTLCNSYFQPVILESDCLLPHFPSYVIIPREWNSLCVHFSAPIDTLRALLLSVPQIKTQQQLSREVNGHVIWATHKMDHHYYFFLPCHVI